jgi:acetyl esterase/lipase
MNDDRAPLVQTPSSELPRLLGVALLVCSCTPSHTVLEDVDYDDRTGQRTMMDVVIPDAAPGAGPAVFLVHGGGWKTGDKGNMRMEAERLADLGFVTTTVGYRLVPDGAYPASSQDVACAWDHFVGRANEYGFDAQRVAVMGYSAGAQLVSLHATGQSLDAIASDCAAVATGVRPAAVISSAGPQRLLDFPDGQGMRDYLGGSKEEARDQWIEASPIEHVDADDPPFLFVHGDGDVIVPIEHARKMQRALDEVGVDNRLFEIPGGGHLFNPGPGGGEPEGGAPSWSPEAFVVIEDFLYDTVGRP